MEIPEELMNSDTGQPIDHCLVCNTHVLENGQPYFLEKIMRNVPDLNVEEVLFEYAICTGCAEQMRDEMSKESQLKIQQYFDEREHPGIKTWEESKEEVDMDHCAMSGKAVEDCREYAYHAVCVGRELHPLFAPYAISDEVMDEIGDQLSAQTIESLDNFKGQHFNGPPEVAKLLNPRFMAI